MVWGTEMVFFWYILRNFIMGRQSTTPPDRLYRPSLAKGTDLDISFYLSEDGSRIALDRPVWQLKNVPWAKLPLEQSKIITYRPSKV